MARRRLVTCEQREAIAIIRLEDPRVHNRLAGRLLEDLLDAVGRLRDSSDLRCVVIAATGDDFSMGTLAAKAIATLVVLGWNFLANCRWTFKAAQTAQQEED